MLLYELILACRVPTAVHAGKVIYIVRREMWREKPNPDEWVF
jgi:hypothetical protein